MKPVYSIVLLIAVCLVLAGCGPTGKAKFGGVLAQVVDVVDGDTIKVVIEGRQYSVRYIGIDAPETTFGKSEPYGRMATDFNSQLVGGKTVELVRDVSETDRYGRLLRYVYVGDTFVNAEIVRQGFASSASFPPDIARQDVLRQAEREARENNRGLWSR
jgi:endonuclease YncB( thermonuclease family)